MVPVHRRVTLVLATLACVAAAGALPTAARTPARRAEPDDDAVCQTYDPQKVQVVSPGSGAFAGSAWRIESAGAPLEQAASQSDADDVAALARFYSVECKIASNKPLVSTVTYWKEPTRPLALAFPEDCRSYDPARIQEDRGVVGELDGSSRSSARPPFVIQVPGSKEGDAVLALARQWTAACVIGGWRPVGLPSSSIWANMSAPEKKQAEDRQNAWHPVYYWKK